MSSLRKHAIYPQRSYSHKLLIFLFSVLPLALLTAYYIHTIRVELLSLKDKQSTLVSENEKLQRDNQELSKKLAEQALYFTTEKITDTALQERLDELQNTVVSLKKELLFYQNITQATTSSKLQVRDLELIDSNSGSGHQVQFRVAISQGGKISEPLTGDITITLNYPDNELVIVGTHKLNLRHIQVIDGLIEISQDKTPEQLIVTISKKDKVILSQKFDWQVQPN